MACHHLFDLILVLLILSALDLQCVRVSDERVEVSDQVSDYTFH